MLHIAPPTYMHDCVTIRCRECTLGLGCPASSSMAEVAGASATVLYSVPLRPQY